MSGLLALVVSVPASEAELAADALWSLGVLAVEERELGTGTEDHLVELWTSLGDDPDVVTRAAEGFPSRWRWRLVELDPSVLDAWRAHAAPTWVTSELVICPAWVDPPTEHGLTVVAIDPGAVFGAGDHPTTVLTLRALGEVLWPGASVLDVGCGSGVLAVTACVLGAGRADAIDISPAAIPITETNARANGVEGRVVASTTPLERLDGPYDVVLANLLAPVLVDVASDLRRVLAPGGVLIVSGVLADRHDHVQEALAPLHVVGTETREGWAALTLRW